MRLVARVGRVVCLFLALLAVAAPAAAQIDLSGEWSVVRRRPTYDEIFAREPAAAWL